MYILLFTRYLLSSINYPEGSHCPYHNHRFPYGLASSTDAYARGLQKILTPPPFTSEFVRMASYAPTCFYELLDDEVESDGSSIGDMAPGHQPSRECAMADAPGQPPVEEESLQTHAPLDPHTGALTLAREHGEDQ